MTRLTATRRARPSEEGYILIAVMFMLAILVLSLAVAAPKIAKEIQRDREVETMHRGKQYARAVRLYYKKFGAYPPNVDALVKTSDIRFLRKKYVDPTTGKDEWKIIRVGQNKTQTLGFFGQPIGGSTVAGTGPGGGNGIGGTSTAGGAGSSSAIGSATDPNTPANPADTSAGATGAPGGTQDAGGNPANGSGTGLSGPTFGGAGIMGFSPNSPKQSILVYKKKNHYNEWEFTYDPLADQAMQGGNTGAVGQPAGSTTTPVGGPTNPTAPPPSDLPPNQPQQQ
jgi:type II secretory pathway pseudopilin PulG